MPFDENLRSDIADVLSVAALLDITEFELFSLAYLRWHGSAASESFLEPIFAAYMFDQVVPPWVRDFTRLVLRLAARGTLDRHRLGVERIAGSPRMVARGLRYAVILCTVIAVLVVMAETVAELMRLAERCMFPPCF